MVTLYQSSKEAGVRGAEVLCSLNVLMDIPRALTLLLIPLGDDSHHTCKCIFLILRHKNFGCPFQDVCRNCLWVRLELQESRSSRALDHAMYITASFENNIINVFIISKIPEPPRGTAPNRQRSATQTGLDLPRNHW